MIFLVALYDFLVALYDFLVALYDFLVALYDTYRELKWPKTCLTCVSVKMSGTVALSN